MERGAGEERDTGEKGCAGDEEWCIEDGDGEKTEEETPRFFFSSAVMDSHL